MCNLAIILQKDPGNEEAKRIMAGQFKGMATQPDGIASLVMSDKVAVDRAMAVTEYPGVFSRAISAMDHSRLVSVHTRIASVGNVSDENVHFFEHNGRYLAHNGHVSAYFKPKYGTYNEELKAKQSVRRFTMSAKQLKKAMRNPGTTELFVERETVEERMNRLSQSVEDCKLCTGGNVCGSHDDTANEVLALENLLSNGKLSNITLIPEVKELAMYDTEGSQNGPVRPVTKDPSDTLQFLQDMPDDLDIEKLAKYTDKKGFSGVGLLVDEPKKKAWIMATRRCDVHTDGKYMIVYSFMPKKDFKEWQYVLGVPLISADETRYETATLEPGIYEIDLDALKNGESDILSAYI